MSKTDTATTTRAPQRLQALERANEIRLARAELKRRIAFGSISAAEVILQPPLAANSWAVGELLLSQRRWGRTRCRKFLLRNQISETKAVGALTQRQRHLLAEQLHPCASREPEVAREFNPPVVQEPDLAPAVESPGPREPAFALA